MDTALVGLLGVLLGALLAPWLGSRLTRDHEVWRLKSEGYSDLLRAQGRLRDAYQTYARFWLWVERETELRPSFNWEDEHKPELATIDSEIGEATRDWRRARDAAGIYLSSETSSVLEHLTRNLMPEKPPQGPKMYLGWDTVAAKLEDARQRIERDARDDLGIKLR